MEKHPNWFDASYISWLSYDSLNIRIYPASQEQMEKCIDSETDEELKKAYSEMLDGYLAHNEEWDWVMRQRL